MKNLYLTIFLCALPAGKLAAEPAIAPVTPERNFDISVPQNRIVPPISPAEPATQGKTISMSKEELLAQPELLQNALDTAVSRENVDGVRFLLPLYQQLPQQDSILVLYAQAMLARADGNLGEAISKYRQIIATHPELTPVRMQLAIVLLENHEDVAATDQFEKIRAQENLPQEVIDAVNQYLAILQERQSWSFNAGIQYLQDSNVNNAPRSCPFVGCTIPEAQSAHGIGYQLSLSRLWPWRNGWNTQLSIDADGKSYWDNHDYDELTLRASAGIGYRNLRSEIALLPFYEKKWYGGEAYAQTPGIRIQASHWLHPRWQLLGALEYGRKIQDQERYAYLEGNSYLASATALFLASPKQYWLAGLDASRETAKDTDNTYNRIGIRAGWGQEWGKGISTQITGGVAKRRYEDYAWATSDMRRDTEYFVTSSIWLRNLHFYGLTPRLTVAWQRYESNHFWYNYQKTKVFMEVGKKF